MHKITPHLWYNNEAQEAAEFYVSAFGSGSKILSTTTLHDTQEDIDYYWEKLSAVPEAEQCGWLKDQYGVSWQIVPAAMDEMMSKGAPEQIERITQAFLPMKKFDIATLQEAYNGG